MHTYILKRTQSKENYLLFDEVGQILGITESLYNSLFKDSKLK